MKRIIDDCNQSHSVRNLEEVGVINEYYFNTDTVDSSNVIYKILKGRYAGNYLLQRANQDEYEFFGELKELLETLPEIEIFHQGGSEIKRAYFEDELGKIATIAQLGNLENWHSDDETIRIAKEYDITDYDKPAYTFNYVGVDLEGNLYLIEYNNTNTTCADRPRAQESSWSEIRQVIGDKKEFKQVVKYLLK